MLYEGYQIQVILQFFLYHFIFLIKEYIDYDLTDVHIVEMQDKEIEEWIATGEAYDKAGAYAIQGRFGVFVDRIQGSCATVIGLPIHKVYQIIKPYIT